MIQVTVRRTKSNQIKSFTISGHANFANKGEDIVCAGVSAVSFGAVNSIIKLTAVQPLIDQGEDGFLRCTIPKEITEVDNEKVQLLLEGMVVSLQTIEQDYNKYIQITTINKEVE